MREWRAGLLEAGVSSTMVAKSYRLLRAILNTAVTEDELIIVNPCRIKGAGEERASERPVLNPGPALCPSRSNARSVEGVPTS